MMIYLLQKKQSVGLVHIKSTRSKASFVVESVLDENTGNHVTTKEAVRSGILKDGGSTYIRPDGTCVSIAEANKLGLLKVKQVPTR